MKNKDKKNLHKGHRQRLKRRFIKEGLSGFEDHEALELLLFYSIPRRDTNELAHRLLRTFGNLKNLFSAEVSDLMQVEGIGEHTAILLKLLPEISSKYWFAQSPRGAQITSIHSAVEFFQSLLYGETVEHFYIACLETSYRVKTKKQLSRGTASQTPILIRHLAETALRSDTELVMIAHNHPSGNVNPSKNDIVVTMEIQKALDALQIRLLDHIIVSDHDYFSFAAEQLIRKKYTKEEASAAKYATGLMNDSAFLL